MFLVAVIDLGSTSFHLMIARIDSLGHYTIVERCKEAVRLREGLQADDSLSKVAQARALACLKRFRKILDAYSISRARVVGTYTLRVVKHCHAWLEEATQILGFPIDIISGEEEARLIHAGAVSCMEIQEPYLVVDIGGGSTELILGQGRALHESISLAMGCVEYQIQFFGQGQMTAIDFNRAIEKARLTVAPYADRFNAVHFKRCLGGSGTLRGLMSILFPEDFESKKFINYQDIINIRDRLIEIRYVESIHIEGLRKDRYNVIAGGLSILLGLSLALGIESIELSEGAIREGLLVELSQIILS